MEPLDRQSDSPLRLRWNSLAGWYISGVSGLPRYEEQPGPIAYVRGDEHDSALDTVRKLGEDLIESRDLLAQTVDTLRAVLMAVDSERPYPWQGGALKQQIREDITAYELLGLDWPVPERAS